jgi:hypothetical protein
VIFMSILWPFILILSVFLQNGSVSDFPTGTFTEKETRKIEKESDDIDGRIDVYRNASIRMQKELKETVSKDGFQDVPGHIQLWTSLVTESLKDIEFNIDPKKKKSKALIKYEIHVRQTINDLRELQIRAPYEQQQIFDSCIERANAARGKMVDILFQPEKVLEEEVEK